MHSTDGDRELSISLDRAIELNPVGFFHYRLLLMCGLTFMTDALEVTLLAFLSNCAAAEWDLSDTEQATLTGMVFLGIVVGSVFWGWFADQYGRRPAYIYCCLIITLGSFISGMAPSYASLTTIRAITGFGIGGASVPFDLLAEFMPISHRGRFLVLTELFWTFGSMFVAGMAWSILPTEGWRALTFACAVPVLLVSTFSYFCLPESPRWLLSKHREREANQVIHEAARINGVVLPRFVISTGISKAAAEESSYADLIATPAARRVTLPLWCIWGLFGITYYGLVLFVSRIYAHDDGNGDDENGDGSNAKCDFDYPPIFYNAASETFAIILSSNLIDRMGRKLSQSFFYALGGVAVACMGMQWSSGWVLFLSILARVCAMSSSAATWVVTPELFPTQLRASGHSTCTAISKLCSFCAPYLVLSKQVSPVGVGIVLGVMNIVAAACAQLLPETGDGELTEGVQGPEALSLHCDAAEVDDSDSLSPRYVPGSPSQPYLLVPSAPSSSHGGLSPSRQGSSGALVRVPSGEVSCRVGRGSATPPSLAQPRGAAVTNALHGDNAL